MVGFPGEGDDDFQQTLQLLEAVRFDNVFSFSYSDRPYASASDLPDKLPEGVKGARLMELQRLQSRIVLEKNREEVGRIREILVEGRSKQRDGSQLTGRTQQNRIVNFIGSEELVGRLVQVRVTDAFQHSLRGGLVADRS